MPHLSRRITKLEASRPAVMSSDHTITLADLSPAVAAIFMARNRDVAQMTLAELRELADDLRRFSV